MAAAGTDVYRKVRQARKLLPLRINAKKVSLPPMPKAKRKETEAPTEAPRRKTVGVPMVREDLEALGRYRDTKAREDMVRPAEGPAALAIFRRGLRALREEARS